MATLTAEQIAKVRFEALLGEMEAQRDLALARCISITVQMNVVLAERQATIEALTAEVETLKQEVIKLTPKQEEDQSCPQQTS